MLIQAHTNAQVSSHLMSKTIASAYHFWPQNITFYSNEAIHQRAVLDDNYNTTG